MHDHTDEPTTTSTCYSACAPVEGTPHYHKDEAGILRKCYHKCKSTFTDFAFWAGITLSFPLEHYLWEKVWPFSWLHGLMGL